jgi:hypothetical protein
VKTKNEQNRKLSVLLMRQQPINNTMAGELALMGGSGVLPDQEYVQMKIIDGSERIIWSMWIMLSWRRRVGL